MKLEVFFSVGRDDITHVSSTGMDSINFKCKAGDVTGRFQELLTHIENYINENDYELFHIEGGRFFVIKKTVGCAQTSS